MFLKKRGAQMSENTPGNPRSSERGPDDVALFTAALDAMQGEANLIWSRYSSMLTASSIIAVVLAAILAKSDALDIVDKIVACMASTVGLLLAIYWWKITTCAWDLSHRWGDLACSFNIEGSKNAFTHYLY